METSTQSVQLMVPVIVMDQEHPPPPEAAQSQLERNLERGLRFAHVTMASNQNEGREGSIYGRAVAELLVDKGLVGKEELDTMMAQVRKDVEALPAPKVLLSEGVNKYECENLVLIDCAERVQLCQARCCSLDFYLTDQDLDEGIVRWDYGRPYWIRKNEDGHCVHSDPATWRCRIHAYRPHACRAYDCRKDKRIWIDFEKRIPNVEQCVCEPPVTSELVVSSTEDTE